MRNTELTALFLKSGVVIGNKKSNGGRFKHIILAAFLKTSKTLSTV